MKRLFWFMCFLGICYAGEASAQLLSSGLGNNMNNNMIAGDSNNNNGLQQIQKCYIDGSGRQVCPGGGISGGITVTQPRCPSNCKTCDSLGKCTACEPGYYHYTNSADLCIPVDYTLADGTKVTHPIVAHPNYCAQAGQKWAGTGATKTRATAACVDINCEPGKTLIKSDGYGVCNQCKAGYNLKNNRCIADPCSQKSCSGPTPTCSLSSGKAVCSCTSTSCGAGGKCVRHPNYNPTTLSNNYSLCVCSSGYYLNSSGGCSKCSANCKSCTDGSTCNTCADGYTLSSGKCVKINTVSVCPPYTAKSSDGCCCIPNG